MDENEHVTFFREVCELQKGAKIRAPHMHGMLAEFDRVVAERNRLRLALGAYGRHKEGCGFKGISFKLYDKPCTCGLAIAFGDQS